MRASLLSLALLAARFASPVAAEEFKYESDIARLMKIVVGNLYESRDVWVRELLSNSNDALEKTRLLGLTNPSLLETAPLLNISIQAFPSESRIVIRDSGIGMTKAQLGTNLGTIARSGTADFLEKLDKGDGSNLIGQFGLGFYSAFLIADKVTVASKSNDSPLQYVFESDSNAQGFTITEDPRGVTLGRGTEITLHVKEDAKEYLETERLAALIEKHAQYGLSPIYLFTETTVTETIEDEESSTDDDSEVKVEAEDEEKEVKTREVTTADWKLVNDRAPLWMRDPKDVTKEEYEEFYKATFKSAEPPLAWTHFKGDAGSTPFRALVYLPANLPHDFYSKNYVSLESLKLFVRRVFITNDLGPDYLQKHLNWVKVFIDADIPLNVDRSRSSLQKTKALQQIKKNLVKRILDVFASLAEKDPAKFAEIYEKCGTALKVGVVEDVKNRDRIVKLLRFETSASTNLTSLSDVVSRRKTGQKQIFFVASAGQKKAQLEKSPFVERILARGYEVLYLSDPMDEMFVSTVPSVEGMSFQDVAKEGLKFGDEADDEDEEALKATFKPLTTYLEKELSASVDKVLISTRLTTSPCLVVTGKTGYSGNMERLIAAQNQGGENFMASWAKMQKKTFEINPKHPLIEALLEKVEDVEEGPEAEALQETIQVLWQTALVKSNFQVPDTGAYFALIESSLRRSLGVSQSARARDLDDIKPAPPIESGPVKPEAPAGPPGGMPEFVDWSSMRDQVKAATGEDVNFDAPAEDAETPSHDEL